MSSFFSISHPSLSLDQPFLIPPFLSLSELRYFGGLSPTERNKGTKWSGRVPNQVFSLKSLCFLFDFSLAWVGVRWVTCMGDPTVWYHRSSSGMSSDPSVFHEIQSIWKHKRHRRHNFIFVMKPLFKFELCQIQYIFFRSSLF